MDGGPCGRIVDQTTEIRHLNSLQPVREDERLVGGELDRGLSVVHEPNSAGRLP
ncbi:hypothetical protein SSCG_02224 [Streptomyces clavuligerus]|nr:hypothetical protein SSCG_02224 [Streptomyces clavuligerus]